MEVDTRRFEPKWSPVLRGRQVLTCVDGEKDVGFVNVGLGALDGEPPAILVDFISVSPEAPYRGGVVSNWLVDRVVQAWPGRLLRGGPLDDDEAPGPGFRLRTWRRGIEFHDGACELVRRGFGEPPDVCRCLVRLGDQGATGQKAMPGPEDP